MKKYEVLANSRNTPHYYERILIGAMFFLFMGINLILPIAILRITDLRSAACMLILGIVSLCRALLVFSDNRSDMVRWAVIACYGVVYLAVSIGIAYVLSCWQLAIIYGYEIVAMCVVVFGLRLLQKNERSH